MKKKTVTPKKKSKKSVPTKKNEKSRLKTFFFFRTKLIKASIYILKKVHSGDFQLGPNKNFKKSLVFSHSPIGASYGDLVNTSPPPTTFHFLTFNFSWFLVSGKFEIHWITTPTINTFLWSRIATKNLIFLLPMG